MKRNLNVLLAVLNAYKEDDFAHFSSTELNQKFGFAKKNIGAMLRELEQLNKIENYTINGYYNRYKIVETVDCPDFVLNKNLSNSQKSFLLRCIEQNISEDLSKKEIARRVNNNENGGNISRSFTEIKNACGIEVFELITNYNLVSGLIPENSIKTEHGYRTNNYINPTVSETKEEKIAKFLIRKSSHRQRSSPSVKEYNLTQEYIKQLLINQEYKDYYTGLIPDNYEEYSIDRIDSSKGYIKDNVVITTNKINLMKSDMSIEEFKNQIISLYNNISNF